MSGAPIVLIDACVLVPIATREIVLRLAREGAYRPRWSRRIEDEWRATARRRAGADAVSAAAVDGEIALARATFPDAIVEGWEDLAETLSLPDWDDRHVLAAAIVAKAQILLTDNLRDFPRRRLSAHALTPESADAFLWRHVGEASEVVAAALAGYASALPPELKAAGLPAHFKRARLPRFAKAIARL